MEIGRIPEADIRRELRRMLEREKLRVQKRMQETKTEVCEHLMESGMLDTEQGDEVLGRLDSNISNIDKIFDQFFEFVERRANPA